MGRWRVNVIDVLVGLQLLEVAKENAESTLYTVIITVPFCYGCAMLSSNLCNGVFIQEEPVNCLLDKLAIMLSIGDFLGNMLLLRRNYLCHSPV